MRFKESKWEDFLDGFHYICSALDAYNAGDEWGYGEFWETINVGWYHEYIYPYDDWFVPSISKERRMRLAQEPEKIILSPENFDALVERLNEPPDPERIEKIKRVLQRKAPWDDDYETD